LLYVHFFMSLYLTALEGRTGLALCLCLYADNEDVITYSENDSTSSPSSCTSVNINGIYSGRNANFRSSMYFHSIYEIRP